MKIEEGKFYRTRSGEKRGPAQRRMEPLHYLAGFPWLVGGDRPEHFYTDTGLWTASDIGDERDLVAEWSEPVLSGPAVELSTLADMDAQPGDVIGMLNLLSKTSLGGPYCRVFDVLEDGGLRARDTASYHARAFVGDMPVFFMIHRAARDAGSIDSSPSEFWETTEGRGVRIDSSAGETCHFNTSREPVEPNPDHEAENSRDALLDGPDWREHCRALSALVRALVIASSDYHRARLLVRNARHLGAAQRDLREAD